MMAKIQSVLIVLVMLLLTSCSLFSPVKPTQQSSYLIQRVPSVTKQPAQPISILVMLPDTSPVYNTSQMAYRANPYQIAYFSQNRWAETPAEMLQPLIVKTLINTHHFRAVGSPPSVGRYDYILTTQLLELQQDFTYRPALLRLNLRVQLASVATNQLIATKDITITQPLSQNTPYGGVLAANRAVEKALGQLAQFCVKHT